MATKRVFTLDQRYSQLRCYDHATGALVKQVTTHTRVNAVALSSGDKHIVVAGESNGGTVIFDAESMEVIKILRVLASSASYSIDGLWLATGAYADHRVRIYNTESYDQVSDKPGHRSIIRAVTFSPSSTLIVSASDDGTSIIWSVPDLNAIHTLNGHRSGVYGAVFTSDYTTVTASHDNTIMVWDVTSGGCLKVLTQHTNWVFGLAVSPNGDYFASGGQDKRVHVFSSATYECVKFIQCEMVVVRVAFADNETVLAGIEGGELLAFDIHTGEVKTTFPLHHAPRGMAATGIGT